MIDDLRTIGSLMERIRAALPVQAHVGRDVLRTLRQTARWIMVDDTGARHAGRNAVCTQIGNGHFTWSVTTGSKSRLSFLDLARAGHDDYVTHVHKRPATIQSPRPM